MGSRSQKEGVRLESSEWSCARARVSEGLGRGGCAVWKLRVMMVCSVKSLQGRSLSGEREKQCFSRSPREKGAALRNANSLTVSRQCWGICIFTQTTETSGVLPGVLLGRSQHRLASSRGLGAGRERGSQALLWPALFGEARQPHSD